MEKKEKFEEDLNKIISSFADNGKLFSNERQFQLEFAWALKGLKYEVFLEVLDRDSIDDKKSYIDIMVKVSENKYVAIELKYTTRQNNIDYIIGTGSNNVVCTFAQGACDVRQLDFLYDVYRLECLLSKPKITKGYAIIMTNDNYSGKDGNGTKYEKVALYDGRTIGPNEEIGIGTKGYEKRKFKLKYRYTCNWKDYDLKNTEILYYTDSGKEIKKEYGKNPFKYMIWKVDSGENT